MKNTALSSILSSMLLLAGCAHRTSTAATPGAEIPLQNSDAAPAPRMRITVPQDPAPAAIVSAAPAPVLIMPAAPAPAAIVPAAPAPAASVAVPSQAVVSSRPPALPGGRVRRQVRALVVVRNNVGGERRLDGLGDILTGALAERGIQAVDPGRFRTGTGGSETLPGGSLAGTAQALRAPYIITGGLNRLGTETVGVPPNQFTRHRLKLSLNISTADGAVFDSWTASVAGRPLTRQQLRQNTDFVLDDLMDKAAAECAEWLAARIDAREALPENACRYVQVTFGCNVPGADIVVDGASIGTAPATCKALEGLHTLRVGHPCFLEYRRQVNFTEGARFDVVLEMSDAGIARWQSQELFKTILQRLKDSGATDDAVRRVLAEGQAAYLKNSHFRWDGALQSISVWDEFNRFERAYLDFSGEDRVRWSSPESLLRIADRLRRLGVTDDVIRKVRRQGRLSDFEGAEFQWDGRNGILNVRPPSGKGFLVK